jgi:hypothetical protein
MTEFEEDDWVIKNGITYQIVIKYINGVVNNEGKPIKYAITVIKNRNGMPIPVADSIRFDVTNLNGYTKVNKTKHGGRRRTHKRSKKVRKSRKARRRHHH